jgi:hypothetical protein
MQEAEIDLTPRPIQLFHQGYKGSDPEHPDTLFHQLFKILNYLLTIQTLSCKFDS